MKNVFIATCSIALLITLAGCAAKEAPADPTAGLSPEEYQQMKEQSARMGMDMDSHMKMLGE